MIKKIERYPMRPDKEPEAEIEIWQPSWKCFCCHDSGTVVPYLASLVIDGYDPDRDRFPLCVNPGCKAASKYDSEFFDASVDRRLKSSICQQLDLLEREAWRKTSQAKVQRIQEAALALAKEKSLRKCDRSPVEEQVSREKHRLVVEEDWGLVAAALTEKGRTAGREEEG